MTEQQAAAYVNAQTTAALLEMEGMKAENRKREADGEAQAYNETHFFHLIEKYGLGHNSVITIFRTWC